MYPFLAPAYRGMRQLLHAPQTLTNILFPKTLALLYHRVNTLADDPYELCVSKKHFEDHILFLKEHFNLLSLNTVYENIKNKKTFHHGVIITFDDGYLDNFLNAFPLLKKYAVPAVIFVAGVRDDMTEFWWDELANIFSKTAYLPDNFSLAINEVKYAFSTMTQDAREKTRNHLHALLQPFPFVQREKILRELYEISSIKRITRSKYARCGTGELKSMANSGLIDIGGHTAHHCRLSKLAPEDQENEIFENYRFLTQENGLKNHVTSFAYPYGTKGDYSDATVQIIKKYYKLAFSNYRGHIHAHTNRYEIPRFVVKNWNRDEFSKKIQSFFHSP